MNQENIVKHPVLIIVRGVPGGGKSYLTAALVSKLDSHDVLVLDPDQIDQTSAEYVNYSNGLAKEGVDEKYHLYRFSRQQAYDAVSEKKIIIWNQGFIDFNGLSLTIKRIEDVAVANNLTLKTLVVEVEIDPETAKSRIAERVRQGGHDVAEHVHAQFVDQYRSFAGNGYPTVVVNGRDSVEQSVSTVLNALKDLTK